jgi:hypothetical protein
MGQKKASVKPISSTMPDWWLPNEFIACCAFGAPSGDEEVSWRLDVGASPKSNARNISAAHSILPLTLNQGVRFTRKGNQIAEQGAPKEKKTW